jgi:lipopolysaccharide transport system ATP-binding protein
MKPIVKVENLSKRYRIDVRRRVVPYETLRETVTGAMRAPFKTLRRRNGAAKETVWALKDVGFEVYPGEVVGIIGRNGAGKSTLLKVLSRIVEPTLGRVELFGRVGSLLEVGTGFHPELTGRENVYLNGAILGMSKVETKQRFDEIVAFAELEKFIDTPVKYYSSGMYMRLGFAVAAHLEPEILIVDEVLAVGDQAFQSKCLGKMKDVAMHGRTVLFVSHSMAAVEKLCRRGVVLNDGQVSYIGTQTEAIRHYLASFNENADSLRERTDRTGSGDVRIVAVEIKDVRGQTLNAATSGQDVDIYLYYEARANFSPSKVVAGLIVATQFESPVFLQHNRLTGDEFDALPPKGAFVCRIPRLPLPPSTYRLGYSLLLHGEYLDMINNAFEFTVTEGDFFGSGEVPPSTHGCCLVPAKWTVEAEATPESEGATPTLHAAAMRGD